MRIIGLGRLGSGLLTATLAASAASCSGSTETGTRGDGIRGGGGAASSGSGNTSNTSNNGTTSPTGVSLDSTSGISMNTSTTGETEACQNLEVNFTPDIPTVFILVDRSSSMWDNMFWDPLRDGVLDVVQRLHVDVRFGFGTFTGAGASCPLDLQDVGIIDHNNYDAIAAFYQAISHPGMPTETPTAAGIQRAREILEADNLVFPGPKFILLVTDGNPDYCDDGQVECRTDTTVRVLQDAYSAGIHTFVVGLPDPGINQAWLTAFANAGAGQPVSAPQDTQYCAQVPAATAALLPTVAPTNWPQGTYGAAMGPVTPYNVDPAQKDQLVSEIAAVIAGVKSCAFDLIDANGEALLTIAEGKEDQGTVTINTPSGGMNQPYDPTGANGWFLNANNQIELVGSSCDLLRNPETLGIEFGFPCEVIIEIPK